MNTDNTNTSPLVDDEMEYTANAEVVTQEIIKANDPSPFAQLVKSVVHLGEDGGRRLDNLTNEKPYQALLVAGGVGLALGLLITSLRK